jgi:hypothetical protein
MKLLGFTTREFIMLTIIGFLVFMYWDSCTDKIRIADSNKEIMKSLADTVRHFRNKDGDRVAQISNLRLDNVKQLRQIKTKDEEIVRLQEVAKGYEKKLRKPGSSVTNTVVETKVDTITETIVDTVETHPVYSFSFKDKWVNYSGVANKDSTKLRLSIINEYSTIVGWDRKQKRWFTDVVNYNDYSEVKSIRTYQTKVPKPKTWAIGIVGAYGVSTDLKPKPFIGAGIMKTILRL